ncbi:MAG: type II secretion system minor pseudopilin GspJ, partial [Magnetococcales bacterium]|nr:type II secretion system minor pseudopilin GspJ [Magnetococcales bacterium]
QGDARRMAELTAWQTLFTRLARDIEQSVPRPVTDPEGIQQPALNGENGALHFLELTHAGRPNPGKAARSNLQRVAWLWQEGRIVRRVWESLDRAGEDPPDDEILLEGVESVAIRFLGGDHAWRLRWPVTPEGVKSLPRAVEIVVEKRGWERMRRLYEVAAGEG